MKIRPGHFWISRKLSFFLINQPVFLLRKKNIFTLEEDYWKFNTQLKSNLENKMGQIINNTGTLVNCSQILISSISHMLISIWSYLMYSSTLKGQCVNVGVHIWPSADLYFYDVPLKIWDFSKSCPLIGYWPDLFFDIHAILECDTEHQRKAGLGIRSSLFHSKSLILMSDRERFALVAL